MPAITFETPENIPVSYTIAGLGTRFTAWMLDQLLVLLVSIGLLIALLVAGIAGDAVASELAKSFDDTPPGRPPELTIYAMGLFYLIYTLGGYVYFGLAELCLRGQTLGKQKMKIRVVQTNGFSLRPSSILVRTVFRVADQLPPLWVVPVVTDSSQRLGDLVAGTVVVLDQPDEIGDLREQLSGRRLADLRYRFSTKSLAKAQDQDIHTVERLLERLAQLAPATRDALLSSVVENLCHRLELTPPPASDHAEFLRDFLTALYQNEYRQLN